jgi:hypothetical protein
MKQKCACTNTCPAATTLEEAQSSGEVQLNAVTTVRACILLCNSMHGVGHQAVMPTFIADDSCQFALPAAVCWTVRAPA